MVAKETHGMSTRCLFRYLICFTGLYWFDIQDANSAWSQSQIQHFGSCSLCLKLPDFFIFCTLQEDWQKQSKQEQRQEPTAQAQAPSQPQTEWVRYKTPDGQTYYHNETTNHTVILPCLWKHHLTCSNLHLLITRWGLFVAESKFSWPVLVFAARSHSSWAIGSGPQFGSNRNDNLLDVRHSQSRFAKAAGAGAGQQGSFVMS